MNKVLEPVENTLTGDQLSWKVLGNSPLASSRTDDIWFFDEQNGWLVNSSGYVCKTTDAPLPRLYWQTLFTLYGLGQPSGWLVWFSHRHRG